MIRRFYERKDFLKNKHIIQRNIFYMIFEIIDFSKKESEAVNILKIKQISSKIKRHKRFKIKLNIKLKDYKKIILKCLIYDIREYNLLKY